MNKVFFCCYIFPIYKRTARLTANIPLVRQNLVPISFNDIAIDDYNLALLSCYELNQIEPLAQLYVWSYLRSCQHYETRAKSLGIDTLRVKYRQQRRQLIADIVTQQLYELAQEMFKLKKLKFESGINGCKDMIALCFNRSGWGFRQ